MSSKAAPQKVYFSGGRLPKEAGKPCDRLKGLSGMDLPRAGRLSPSRRRLLAARDMFPGLQTHDTACSGCTILAVTGASGCTRLLPVKRLSQWQ